MRVFLSTFLLVLLVNGAQAAQVGDIDGDDQIGLTEAIIALQVSAGQNPAIPDTLPGLTECNGNWINTTNNPEHCGECETVCDSNSLCHQGQCIRLGAKRPGEECVKDTDCFSGFCNSGVCEYVDPTLPRKIFVTSTTYNGDLGGLEGADAKCKAQATAAGIKGSFKAWLSDSSLSAGERMAHSQVAYTTTTGIQIASNWEDLTDGLLDYGIIYDENQNLPNHPSVWTATLPDGNGNQAEFSCENWTSASPDLVTVTGSPGNVSDSWTKSILRNCNEMHALYCVQQ